MAKIVATDTNNLEQLIDDFNNLASAVGGDSSDIISQLGDSNVIATLVRLDSNITAASDALTLVGQGPAYYLNWKNFTNKPGTDSVPEENNLYYTTARADSAIDDRVTPSFINAMDGVDVDTLGGRDSDYLTDYSNLQNISIDGADIQYRTAPLEKLDSATVGSYTILGSYGGTGTLLGAIAGDTTAIRRDITMGNIRTMLNVEDGATADQDSAEIQSLYDAITPTADSAIAASGTSATIHTWSPAIVKEAVETHAYKILPTDSDIKTATFDAYPGVKYMVNTTGGGYNANIQSGSQGDLVGFVDYGAAFDSANLTLIANGGQKILGSTSNLVLDKKYMSITFEYVDTTKGWVIV